MSPPRTVWSKCVGMFCWVFSTSGHFRSIQTATVRICSAAGDALRATLADPHISLYRAARLGLRVEGLFSRRPDPHRPSSPHRGCRRPHRPRYIAVDGVDAGPKPARPRRFPLPFSSPPLQFLAAGRNQSPRHAQIDATHARSMSGYSSIGRGGDQVGRGGPSRGRSGDDDEEARKRRSDAARLRGSRRWTNYELWPPPKFYRWEARANQGCPLLGSPASVPAASRRSR
jgi:hypothetical protein